MPADIDPSPITAIARPGSSFNLFATAKPSAALIEVDECAAPNGSYSLSLRLVKPDRPPPWRSVRMRRSEEHTSELQSLMRISYAVFCLKKKIPQQKQTTNTQSNTNQSQQ